MLFANHLVHLPPVAVIVDEKHFPATSRGNGLKKI